jgi:tetratricopeptide (TPR) repeat protein
MKKSLTISLVISSLMLLGIIAFNQVVLASGPVGQPYQTEWVEPSTDDSILHSIEARIDQAFVGSLMGKDQQALSDLLGELEAYHAASGRDLAQYWMSYLQYYQAIYHLQMDEEKRAEQATEAALARLERLDAPNSEDYALMAMIKGFSIQFAAGIKSPFLGAKAKKYGEQALAIDSTNLRAYFVLASNDYYTPEQFGGRKQVESYLKKALALPAQSVPNPYLPAWGREAAHEMLIKFYLSQERYEEAKTQFRAANEEFPDSYLINQLASKLVGR